MKDLSCLKPSLIWMFCCCTFIAFSQSVDETYEGITEIDINIAKGMLLVEKSNTNKVSVKGKYDEEHVDVQLERQGSSLKIKEKARNNSNQSDSEWVLSLPNGIELDANIGKGKAAIEGLEGEFDTNIGAGSCEVRKLAGEIEVNIGSGTINVLNSSGELELNSGVKDMKIENFEGKIEANSGTGDLVLSGIKAIGDIELNSGTGDVELALAAQPKGDIELNSGTGDAVVDFNGYKISGEIEMRCDKRRGEIAAPFDFEHIETRPNGNSATLVKRAKIGSSSNLIQVSTGTGKAAVKQ